MRIAWVGVLVSTVALAAPWPGEPFMQAVDLTPLVPGTAAGFGQQVSDLYWNPFTRTLWVARAPGGVWALTEAADGGFRVAASYPAMSGTTPKFTYKRMLGGGDVFVVEATIDYGDGVPVSYVGVGELRDGKVAKMTEYFANPFEAPAWRADFVERMDPVTA